MKFAELNGILEKHKHWLNEDCEGWEIMRADLRCADLICANLRDADLRDADLRCADLRGANLRCADLRGANLTDANLRCADLRGANLGCADLRGANLTDANLIVADFRDADLRCADLRGANLTDANLIVADFRGADLRCADLRCADLIGAKNVPFIPYACPDFGVFIGYKKADGYIVELEIPEDAKRLSATTRKCRCDKAKVLRILNEDRTVADVTEVASDRDKNFVYKVGENVTVDDFDENRWNECSTGIHFFINFQEAVNYKS